MLNVKVKAQQTLSLREELVPQDMLSIRKVVESTGFFTEQEVEVAIELVEDRISRIEDSDYQFLVVEVDGKVVGYSCYGWISVTEANYDLYWIVVDNNQRGNGLGQYLMEETEARIRKLGGARLYAETSGQEKYAPTQRYYEKCGFYKEAVVKDFYRQGDDKLIYTKIL